VASPAHRFAKEPAWVASTSIEDPAWEASLVTEKEELLESPINLNLDIFVLEQTKIHAPSPTSNSDKGNDTL
jgi:hypothetical protein